MANPRLVTKNRVSEDLLAVLATNNTDAAALRDYLGADSECDYQQQFLEGLDPGAALRTKLEELFGLTPGGGVLPSAYRYRLNERNEPANAADQNASYSFSADGTLIHSLGLINDPSMLVNTVVMKNPDYTVNFMGERGGYFLVNGPGVYFVFINLTARMSHTGYVLRLEGAEAGQGEFNPETANWVAVGSSLDTRPVSVHDLNMNSIVAEGTITTYQLQAQGLISMLDPAFGNYKAFRVVLERIGADGSDVAVPDVVSFLKASSTGSVDIVSYMDVIAINDTAEPVDPDVPVLLPPTPPDVGTISGGTLTFSGTAGDFLPGMPRGGYSVSATGLEANEVYTLKGYARDQHGISVPVHFYLNGQITSFLLMQGSSINDLPVELVVPVSQFQRVGNNGYINGRAEYEFQILFSKGTQALGFTGLQRAFIDGVAKTPLVATTTPAPSALMYQIITPTVSLSNFDPYADYHIVPELRRAVPLGTWAELIDPAVLKNQHIRTGPTGADFMHPMKVPLNLSATHAATPAPNTTEMFEFRFKVTNMADSSVVAYTPVTTINIFNAG